MNTTQQLHNLGQSLWLDNITRDLLNNGTLERYIAEIAITGLTMGRRARPSSGSTDHSGVRGFIGAGPETR